MSDTVIGLEVHLQLKTVSKIFCGCSTQFGASPNSQVCPVCLGLPGVLPVLNRQVLLYGIRVALGLGCQIQPRFLFHRKNYFYPDLPKGYQISQYDLPLGTGGELELSGAQRIRIRRVHMEEDAGKLIHPADGKHSLVDLNRAGVPLLEIVSEPDLNSPEQAHEYLKILKGVLEYLEVSDCDMEKGSLRCDANVSLAADSDRTSGTRVEIKNLNSFRAVARALGYEVDRQAHLLAEGQRIVQETRLWDDAKGVTQPMRSKEYAHDYRYFPEPDLVPFTVSGNEVEDARRNLPELPAARAQRFISQYGLPNSDAVALTRSRQTADYFEACASRRGGNGLFAKSAANWVLGDLSREMNDRNLDHVGDLAFPPEHLMDLLDLIDSGKISGKMAKDVLAECLARRQAPAEWVQAKGLAQVTDPQRIEAAAQEVVQQNPKAVEDYRKGKAQALMFLVGQVMKKTKGAASPGVVQSVLGELLDRKGSG